MKSQANSSVVSRPSSGGRKGIRRSSKNSSDLDSTPGIRIKNTYKPQKQPKRSQEDTEESIEMGAKSLQAYKKNKSQHMINNPGGMTQRYSKDNKLSSTQVTMNKQSNMKSKISKKLIKQFLKGKDDVSEDTKRKIIVSKNQVKASPKRSKRRVIKQNIVGNKQSKSPIPMTTDQMKTLPRHLISVMSSNQNHNYQYM